MDKILQKVIELRTDISIGLDNEISNVVDRLMQIQNDLEQLKLYGVSKSLNADELINSLGTPDVENEYIVKPDTDGTWWMEHKHLGSGEPLKQWLTGKP